MDGLPWPTITAATGGWVLAGVFVLALITGRLVTRREADIYLERAERAEGHVDTLLQAVAETTTIGKLQKAVIDAGMRRAREDGEHV